MLDSSPYLVSIDACSGCQLKCRFCPAGEETRNLSPATMSFEDFKNIMEQLGHYLYSVEFGNCGEPLLCDKIYEMISYAKEYGVHYSMNTNLHGFDRRAAERMVNSGLDFLNVTVSGASQETYGKYKIGGKFEVVIDNLKNIIDIRKNLNKYLHVIRWQYLVLRYNEAEIGQAERMAKNMGVNDFVVSSPWIYDVYKNVDWISSNDKYSRYRIVSRGQVKKIFYKQKGEYCFLPWKSVTINANGSVFSCCGDIDEKYALGNVSQNSFSEICNNKKYQGIRQYILGKRDSMDNCCAVCKNIHNIAL